MDSLEARARFAVKFMRQSFRKGLEQDLAMWRPNLEAQALDQPLWDDDESFIPHEIDRGDSPTGPVGIGWQDPP